MRVHMHSVQARKREWDNQELTRRRALSARSANRISAIIEARERAEKLAATHERAKPWMILVEMASRLSMIKVCLCGMHSASFVFI